MKYKLSDLVDVDRLQELMDDFYQVSEAPTAILEADGTVLTATAWQPICTEFHRVCPKLAARCAESDVYIADHLEEGEPYAVYECANGLVDVAAPIVVDGEHIGTVFTGQFLFEEPDVERFRKQAQEFDLDEEAYLEALADVPVVSRDRLEPLLTYLSKFAEMLAGVGLERLEQIQVQAALHDSEEQYRSLVENVRDVIYAIAPDGTLLSLNPAFEAITGWKVEERIGEPFIEVIAPAYADFAMKKFEQLLTGETLQPFEVRLNTKSGDEVIVEVTASAQQEDGEITSILGTFRNITERKLAEIEQQRFTRQLDTAAQISEQVGSILDPDELLETVIPLIKEQFGLYYVHVYTLDEESGMLNLRAGYGEAGEKMLAEGHSIPLDREASLVATAARTKESVLVDDVTENPNFMPNPLLPDTKTEVAIPSIAGGKVLGVFDVQHDEAHYFTQADLDVFQTLAAQIANAFRSARLFEAQAEAEAEARRNAAQREALLNAIPDLMFRFDSDGTFLDYKAEAGSKLLAPPEAFLGHHISEVLPPFLAEITVEHLDHALKTGEQVVYEYQAPVGDEMRAYEARMVPSGDGEVLSLIRDITERKQAEIERERFTQRLDTAAQISEQVGSILDPDELLETVIPLIKEQFGLYYVHVYTLDEESGMLNLRAGYGEAGEKMLAEGHSIPLDREASLVATAARTKESVLVDDVTENPNFMPNPLLPDTKTEVAIPSIAGGKVLGVFDVQHDEAHYFTQADLDVFQTLAAQIANAFRSAELLEEAEEAQVKFQTVADYTYDWEYWLGPEDEFLYVSPACEKITGYTVDEFMDDPQLVDKIVHPDDREMLHHHMHAYHEDPTEVETADEAAEVEFRIITKDGEVRWIGHACQPVYGPDGDWLGRRASNRDATEAKRAEIALRENERELSNALRIAKMGYWDFDVESQKFIFNDQYYKTFHNTTAEEVGGYEMSAKEFAERFVPPEEAADVGKNIQLALETTDPDFELESESRNLTIDGEEIWVSVWLSIEKDAQGNTIKLHGVNQDITERKQAEAERERFTTQLDTAAQISEQVGSILDPDELLETVIPLIKEQFGLYYVHVYTLDEESGMLNLRAGYGEAGEKMLAEGHSIPLDREASLVATAARTKESVLVDDVTEDPNFMPNPLLPDTKTEVAIPSIAGGKVLGVFDVQHDKAHYFTPADVDVFQTLAAQIANAFHSAEIVDTLNLTQFSVDHGPAAIYWMRPDASLFDVNETACRMLGYSREELLSMERFTDLDPNFPPEAWAGHWEELKEKQRMTIQTQHQAKDGTIIPVEVEVNYLKYGDQEFDCAFARDITERVEAEERLRANEERLSLALESGRVGIWEFWPQKDKVYFNPTWYTMLGYEPDELPQELSTWGMLLHPDDAERANEIVMGGVEAGEDFHLQFQMKTKDGSWRWIQAHGYVTEHTPEGMAERVIGTHTDITEQKLAQEELREAETQQRVILETTPVGIAITSVPEGSVLYVNPEFMELLGYTEEDVMNQVVPNFYASQEEAEATLALLQSQNGSLSDHEIRAVRADGSEIWLSLSFQPLEYGGQPASLVAFVDITERRQTQIEVERFAGRLNTAAQISEQVGSILDPDELLKTVIPLIKEQFGLYYVHVYTLDEESGMLNLQAGYGEAGEKMLAAGHSIPLDREASLVATAARTKESVLVDDVTENPNFMPNPLLPDTKTEVAVPSIAGGKVLGVFDVQHDEAHYFTDADVDVFQTLAAQIANAFHSAELLEEAEEAQVKFQLVADFTYDWEYWLGVGDEFVYISPACERITGYSPQEFMDNPQLLEEIVHPDDRDVHHQHMYDYHDNPDTLESAEEAAEAEYRIVRKDGEVRWIGHACQPVYGPEGEWLGRRASNRDITEAKQAEAERERFTTQLDTAAQISEQVGSILDPDELLETVIPLIKEQFGLYYVHVYTLDEESGMLNLRAGYGEAGEKMLAEGHSIPLDREASLVATAARTKESVLVDDVTENPNFMPNPLLPDTKTEVAVPSIAGGKVLGVFDVQHDKAHYFTQADLDVFQTLAAQIANAFHSAEAFNAAEQAREQAQTYLNVAGSIIVALNTEGNVVLINKAGCDVLGYEEAEILGQNWFEVSLPEEVAEGVNEVFQQIIAGDIEQAEYYENEIQTRSGETRIVAWRNSLITDEAGNITGILSSGEDITERKLAQEAIQASEARFRILYDNSPIGFVLTDFESGEYLQANQAYLDILGGYTLDGLNKLTYWELTPKEYMDAENEQLQTMQEVGHYGPYEKEYIRKDGTRVPTLLNGVVVTDPNTGRKQVWSLVEDITEQLAAQEAMRESQQKFQTVADFTYDWEYWLGPEDEFLYVSPACERITGYTVEEFMDDPQLIDKIVYPDDREILHHHMHAYQENPAEVATAEESAEVEFRITTKDGDVRWIGHVCQPVYGADGEWLGRRASNRDATESKRAEIERARFTTQLDTAAQISEQVGSILDPDELLQTVIPLIKEQFGLYYVHVYTLDEESGMLNLRAGYGEAGEKMLAEGHSIPLDREASLVATAARTKESVLVDDVTENPNFMPNPLLPDTKTEVAVPSIAGGKVLGVFDVQHDEAHYFTDADLDVFQTLAAQIANAFHSAELFDRVEHQRALYDGILTHLPIGVMAVDNQFDTLLVNEAAQDMLGREVTDKEGNVYVEQYDVVYYETGERFPEENLPLVKAVTQGVTSSQDAAAVRQPDGSLVPMLINAAPLLNLTGDQMGGVVIFADTTEQRETQEAIRENQVKFQTVADYTYDWEYWLGPEDEFLYVSPACKKITGYTVEEFMDDPQLIDKIVHPDDREILHHHMHAYHENPAEVTTAEESAEVEFRITTKDGDVRWIGHACQAVYGPDGEWLGRRASNRDATEAVEARESLAQNEERLSIALESGRVGIWEFWPQRDEVYFNPTYYTMLGYEPYELPQDLSTWSGLMSPEDADRANEIVMNSVQKGEDFHLQFQMQTKEGDWRWIQAHGYVTEHTPEGMAERVIGTHTDITERKLAQIEQERLSAVLEATTDFVGIATPDGKGIYFNQAGREMVGIPMEADPGEYEIISFTPERELTRTQEEIIPTALQEGAWTGESFIRPLGGEEIPVLMTVISITDEAGNLQYLANIARDITDIRAAREAQARFAAQLSTAAEIATRVNAVLNPDELFDLVIPLTKERFNLYHVHFYAFDPESETLNLRSGYGRAGELMLRQGHKIPYDRERSIVARAARDRELVVVNDVTAVPDYLPNMLLPDTKSEVAVPAIVGDHLLGVLDVQADKVDFFSKSDLDVYRTLVGQIATAYQNARYFERQHESEAALRESAEKIRAIFNAITDGISVTNMTGEITDLNEALLDLHGYKQRDELLGRNTMELIARDDWPIATQNINHTLDEGSSRDQEMLLVQKGGGVFDGEVSTALLQDNEGNPTGIISVVRDISDRKRREAALRLTRASVDNAEDEIFWFDAKANFFDVNQAACDILGYPREELLEMQVFDIDSDFPEEAWPGLVSQLREEGAVTLTSQHITKDGDIFPVEVTVNYLKFGGEEYFFSFAHDITERQRVEEERRRFTTQLRTAAEVAAQINTILDPQALLAEVVPLVQERFDLYHVHVYTFDEETNELVMRVGTGEAGRVMLEEGHKIALGREKSLVARSARTKQPVLVNDVTQDPNFMPNPLLPDTKSEVAVPAIAGDRVLGVFDVQDDKRNRFTESDLDVFATLASQIAIAFQNAQYFEEVQRTAERLREVDRLKGEFLANMSHELRTPLNSILGYTEVILMGIDGPINDEMNEDIDAIHKNGKHLLRLINDILDLTKIEAGRLKLEQEEVYVAALFDDVRTNNIGYFHKQKSNLDFRVEVLDEDMRVYADRVRLTQILNNLVSNAAKFTDEGYVEMRAYREDDWVCMEVKDTGIGIAEDDIETIFERFRQVDGSNARRAEGTGLGLAITKHLVEMHGGHLKVHSEPGNGSIFSAYFPLYEPEAEEAPEEKSTG